MHLRILVFPPLCWQASQRFKPSWVDRILPSFPHHPFSYIKTVKTMASPRSSDRPGSPSILDKLDDLVPAPLAQYDAFPKIPSTYKARSESRGFFTLFVGLLAFLLVLNDLGEYIWGWPDYEFSVDPDAGNEMEVNVDVVVNMPCQCTSYAFSIKYGHAYSISGRSNPIRIDLIHAIESESTSSACVLFADHGK